MFAIYIIEDKGAVDMAGANDDISTQSQETLERSDQISTATNGNHSELPRSIAHLAVDNVKVGEDSSEPAAKRVKLDNHVQNVPNTDSRKVKGVALIKPE